MHPDEQFLDMYEEQEPMTRLELEDKISGIIKRYEESTGNTVDSINLSHASTSTGTRTAHVEAKCLAGLRNICKPAV